VAEAAARLADAEPARSQTAPGPSADRERAGVEVEVTTEGRDPPLAPEGCERAARAALAACGVADGHVAVAFVDPARIRELNAAHRGIDRPTDVLSFPVDGPGPAPGPRELGDVVVCPEHTADLEEAVVHGVLHLCGHDHEADEGEMLALQTQILRALRG
jgi:probable rRNA maturation factor